MHYQYSKLFLRAPPIMIAFSKCEKTVRSKTLMTYSEQDPLMDTDIIAVLTKCLKNRSPTPKKQGFVHDSGLNNTGSYNTFLGGFSGYQNQDGERNTFVGYSSGYNIGSPNDNTMVGYEVGRYNEGKNNSFFGSYAGYSNSNYQEVHYAHSNTLIGYEAGKDITEGDYNAFFGSQTGKAITLGANNTFIGTKSGINNTEGNDNVFMGYEAGRTNQIGVRRQRWLQSGIVLQTGRCPR